MFNLCMGTHMNQTYIDTNADAMGLHFEIDKDKSIIRKTIDRERYISINREKKACIDKAAN